MIDPSHVPEVTADEVVARFIVSSNEFRSSDGTVKPDAFIPRPYVELSVTRHRDATDDEIWAVGQNVAEVRRKALKGRADVAVQAFIDQALTVRADAVRNDPRLIDNPNHALVLGWPADDYARQKSIAQEISVAAKFVRPPS
jgi:hypothetical protein